MEGNPETIDGHQPQRTLPFDFRGDGTEFFKIWIVNILLSIVTLGIYSAWAKVRTNRYFYSNLYLDGSSFQYLAEPIAILKGRIIATIAFVIYIFCTELYPVVGLVFAILLMLAIPFLVTRSIAFNHRMSAYRNIQFRFHGGYGEAAMALYVWPLLGILSFGLLYPLALVKLNRFIVNNSAFGTSAMTFHAGYRDYGVLVLILIGGMFASGTVGALLAAAFPPLAAVAVLGYAATMVYFIAESTNLYYNATTLGDHEFDADLEFTGLLKVYAINTVLIVLTLGLYLPAAKVRLARYRAEHISFIASGELDGFVAAEQENVSALGEEMGEVFDFDIGTI